MDQIGSHWIINLGGYQKLMEKTLVLTVMIISIEICLDSFLVMVPTLSQVWALGTSFMNHDCFRLQSPRKGHYDSFGNENVYEILSALLRITPAPNDGSLENIKFLNL